MKKLVNIILVILIFTVSAISVTAEEDYSDTTYWDAYCEGYRQQYDSDSEEYAACAAYQTYRLEQTQDRITYLNDLTDQLEGDLEAAQRAMAEYSAQILAVQEDIAVLQVEIDALQVEIEELQIAIDEQQALVDVLNNRVLTRMAAVQSTMHFNTYLEFLLGASSFEDLLRRGYGLETLMAADEALRDQLQEVMASLENDKLVLEDSLVLLDEQMAALELNEANLNTYLAYQQQIYEETYLQIEETLANLQEEYQNYADIASNLDLSNMPNSEGFIHPVPTASISAGTWYYPASFGGGVHLGVDYAASLGTNVYAPANGVVLVTSDGCPYGYLGDSCGAEDGGVSYGGNQVFLMVAAGNSIYAVTFSHLLAGSILVEEGDVVYQGQVIAQVGSSGNSTGPHCHVVLFYLGEGTIADIPTYLQNNYSLSFNCGWGTAALNYLCENGVSAPCRLRPELYFTS